jgi:hypothetical protein
MSMSEVIALENEIMDALPAADRAAGTADASAPVHTVIRFAHDVLCNGWAGPGQRLERLRTIAAELRRFAQ